MKHRSSSTKGFTLIEILVVVAVTAIISTLAIVYSHTGQNEVNLSIEASKISELILQAKQLSVATYSANSQTCAYGVHFDFTDQTYSLFAYDSETSTNGSAPFCPSFASTTAAGVITADMVPYLGGATFQIPTTQGVVIESSSQNNDVLTDVLFYPPNPATLISVDDATFPTPTPSANVYLKTADGKSSMTISVTSAGQVGY
jgi:prepilin-type N-terminal cleavage/methylation domain-containing protein